MTILARFIFQTVITAMVAMVLAISAIDFLFALLDQLGQLSAQYPLGAALLYVALDLPSQWIEFAPVASLIGALIALGIHAGNSELVVMRAAGWSPLRIMLPALTGALVLASLSLVLAQWAVPWAAQAQQQLQPDEQQALWFRDDDAYVRVRRIIDNRLDGMTLFRMQAPSTALATAPSAPSIATTSTPAERGKLSQVIQAKHARFDQQRNQWQLEQVQIIDIDPNWQTIHHRRQPSLWWQGVARPQQLRYLARAPEDLSISALVDFIDYRTSQGLRSERYRLSLWKTMLQPLANCVMVVLAGSLVFGSMRAASMGYRVTIGLSFGLGFFYMQDLFGFLSIVYGIHPGITLSIPLLGLVLWAWWRYRSSD